MAQYTPVYKEPYEGGFVNAPPYKTPVTAEILNAYGTAIGSIETYLKENPIEADKDGSSADITSGTADAKFRNLSAADSISMNRADGTHTGGWSCAVGGNVTASASYSHAEGSGTKAEGFASHAEGVSTEAKGEGAHAEGSGTVASASYTHAEGNRTKASSDNAHAEGSYTEASSTASHAEGVSTKAAGYYSHAEGYGTQALQSGDHAEGMNTVAAGNASHAEGNNTRATGGCSHAEGSYTVAGGNASHAEGMYTTAAGSSQHVQGQYNIEDKGGKYAHIVGNGRAENERSNAHTLDWEGNAWYAGTVECGGIILTDTVDATRRYLIQVTDGQLVAAEIVAQETE